MATPTSAATPSFSTLLSLYQSRSAPCSQRESPEGSPRPQEESPKEEEKEGYGEEKVGAGYLIPLKAEGSMNLSSIRLDQPLRRGPQKRSPFDPDLFKPLRRVPKSRPPLRKELFIDPSQQLEESVENPYWMLEAQDQILFSQYSLEELRKLIHKYKETPNHAESHRFYVHLHVLTKEQKKTEQLFLQHIEQFPKDVLIWKVFVTFLKHASYNSEKKKVFFRYHPQGIIDLLSHPNLQALQNLSWFQETLKCLREAKPDSRAQEISPTLKKCVQTFQGNLNFWSQWTLKAEDALTRCYSRVVQPGKDLFSFKVLETPLTPRRKKELFHSLICQFQDPSRPSLPVEIHRLYLRLKLRSSNEISVAIVEHKKSFPKDHLAEYYILSSIVDHEDLATAHQRCTKLIFQFPYLHWIEQIIAKIFPSKETKK